ncbi:MAG: T9SS type A sorting domain-containing protein [Ignavibacteriae bacterium]|nr:T9SS type A sorting domain-containing protein [Ignavibacteriota bacterium]MCB9243814.1 T9SS type A sorting domain-containing protein [Ignavibacteriales bacterium]
MKKFTVLFILLAVIPFGLNDVYSQWNYGSPISTSAPSPTWQQVQNKPPFNEMFDSLSFPYPTNAWFNNFLLQQTSYPSISGNLGGNKAFVYPYQVNFGWNYVSYSNPKGLLAINYKPFQVNETGGTTPIINWDDGAFLFMGITNPTNIKPSIKNDYTDLSATIRFTNTSNTNQYYEAPLVRGMPYVTMIYNSVIPGVYFPSPAVLKVNDLTVSNGQQFTGTSFKVETTGSPGTAFRAQTWMIYSSSSITLEFSQSPQTLGLVATGPFTGYLRVAHVTYDGEGITSQQITDKINLLNRYAKFVPVKGEVAASIGTGSSTASINFNFTRYNEGSLGSDSLLMMALPHHADIISNPTSNTLKYAVLKGNLTEVYGKSWTMTEDLPVYSWYPQNGKLATVPLQWCDTVQHYVNEDLFLFNRLYLWQDIYSRGKNLAKLARAIVIADELFERDNVRYASVQNTVQMMRDSLKLYLGAYLDGKPTLLPSATFKDSVLYDAKYGGLISSQSYDSVSSPTGAGTDYGSALYNDHHFHYGYILYTAAAIAKKDPGWFTANSNHYLNRVMDLIRDIANPNRSDGHYALNRYKDWFDGNSWANGLVPYGGGKNQESSSEAINAWYGMYLFGLAMGNDDIKNTGALYLQQEVRAVKKYYHITLPQTNPVYPSYYTNNYHIVTNLYQNGIDAHTFFLTTNYTIHGIQVIPVTPVTEQLWKYAYSKDIYDYPNGLGGTECFNPSNTNVGIWNWTTINVGVQAVAYPNNALSFFPNYGYDRQNYDNGASQSNVIYWILTRIYNPVGISQIGSEIPSGYSLKQNYPNPFNPTTTIGFEIPAKSLVKLAVYDVLGREVAKLVNSELNPGSYRYEFKGSSLSSGVYYYVLKAGNYVETKKMILTK